MTFVEILQAAYDLTGNSQSPPTEVSRRFKRSANRWNRKILSSHGMDSLRRVSVTQASIASQATYGVALQALRYLTESATQRRLTEKTLAWYRDTVPDPTAWTGTPKYYVPMGWSRVHTRPANPSELFAKSTEAADIGTIYVEAIRSTGYRVSLSKVLSGTTAVSLSTTITDIIDVVNVYLSAAQTGTVTLHEDSGLGTELSRLPIGQTVPRFFRYALVPTPSQVITYTLDGIAPLVEMTIDTDEPFPNPDFHDILVDGILHDEFVKVGRMQEARVLMNGGNAQRPTPDSIDGRLRRLRASILEWDETAEDRPRTFEDTIALPVS